MTPDDLRRRWYDHEGLDGIEAHVVDTTTGGTRSTVRRVITMGHDALDLLAVVQALPKCEGFTVTCEETHLATKVSEAGTRYCDACGEGLGNLTDLPYAAALRALGSRG